MSSVNFHTLPHILFISRVYQQSAVTSMYCELSRTVQICLHQPIQRDQYPFGNRYCLASFHLQQLYVKVPIASTCRCIVVISRRETWGALMHGCESVNLTDDSTNAILVEAKAPIQSFTHSAIFHYDL